MIENNDVASLLFGYIYAGFQIKEGNQEVMYLLDVYADKNNIKVPWPLRLKYYLDIPGIENNKWVNNMVKAINYNAKGIFWSQMSIHSANNSLGLSRVINEYFDLIKAGGVGAGYTVAHLLLDTLE